METNSQKEMEQKFLDILENVRREKRKPRVLIFGFGSVAQYLLEYLTNNCDYKVTIATRNIDKAKEYINCIQLAGLVRTGEKCNIELFQCDLMDERSIDNMLTTINPDVVVNTSRYLANLKYGSISWKFCRAYGYWLPMSMMFVKRIGEAIMRTNTKCIFINTSYPDATNAWLVNGIGFDKPIFGAGNINHIVARFKPAFVELWNLYNPSNQIEESTIEVLMEAGHFYDVLIGKEGTDKTEKLSEEYEGSNLLVAVKPFNSYDSELEKEYTEFAKLHYDELLSKCALPFPSDKTRNMMVASSVFEILDTIIQMIVGTPYYEERILNIPGAYGTLGGKSVKFNFFYREVKIADPTKTFGVDKKFSDYIAGSALYQDGIDASEIRKGIIKFVNDKKLAKLEDTLHYKFNRTVHYSEIDENAKNIANAVKEFMDLGI